MSELSSERKTTDAPPAQDEEKSIHPDKAAVTKKDKDKKSLLHAAALRGDIDSVMSQLDLGADVDEIDDLYHSTPLMLAATNGHLTICKRLVAANAQPERPVHPSTAVHNACANGHVDIVRFFLECKANIDAWDNATEEKRTPLMEAVYFEQVDTIRFLVENKADVSLRTRLGARSRTARDFVTFLWRHIDQDTRRSVLALLTRTPPHT